MAGEQAMELLTTAEQALASIELLPASTELPQGMKPVEWEELDGRLATTQTGLPTPADHEVIDLRIELGRARLCWDEMRKLQAGAVVPLDNTIADPVDIYAGGRLIARGEVLAVNGCFGVRIVELARF